ncbi:protein sidekick-1-like, partial [Anneissia japonica]|uniref:protein sidekick-1-like n=1 Tax=Anneissia japonica TaxID=1529436 RepID=UPI0014258254
DNTKYIIDGKTITIPDADPNGSGVFQCYISNAYGIYIDQATYKVTYVVPDVTKDPTDVRVVEGMDASFICEFVGKPNPAVTWKYKTNTVCD